jgi:hypothetical protein
MLEIALSLPNAIAPLLYLYRLRSLATPPLLLPAIAI